LVYDLIPNNFDVTVEERPNGLSKSWLITFTGEQFRDEVADLVVLSNNNAISWILPSGISDAPFATVSGTTVVAFHTVTNIFRAGGIQQGVKLYLRMAAINVVGIGSTQVAKVFGDQLPGGSINPHSPPGLPVNTLVFAVPSSVGDELLVTWEQGDDFGSPITYYQIQSSNDYANNNWRNVSNVTAISGQSSYSALINVDDYYVYRVRIFAYNDLGSSGPLWYQFIGDHDTTASLTTVDFYSGAKLCSPTCPDGLEECFEDDDWDILARGLPHAPVLEVPGYPDVDNSKFFDKENATVYYFVPSVNGNNVDKYRVEWGTDNLFQTDAQSWVGSELKYQISGLIMGKWYYLRVTAHNSLGYGTPSNVYSFKPHQQPDAPQSPSLGSSTDASDMVIYARSLTARWQYPAILDPDVVGDGGDAITGYVVEWSTASFADSITPTVQKIQLNLGHAATNDDMSFRLSLTTTNTHDRPHDGEYYYSGQYFVTGTFKSCDIFVRGSQSTFKIALENMPNIAEVSVDYSYDAAKHIWLITFNEVFDVPLIEIYSVSGFDAGLIDVTYAQNFALSPSSTLYKWMEIPADAGSVPTSFLIPNLIPGVTYYARVSAKNDLGYGKRRLTAPMMATVPITQPTVPTQLEGSWGGPRLYVASRNSLFVKIGAPAFDGGSLVSNFQIEWDTVSSFDSGKTGALGIASIPAYKELCAYCVVKIDFPQNIVNPTVTVTYDRVSVGSTGAPVADIIRQLQTGSRIIIPTSDDGIAYTFVVADMTPTSSSFQLKGVELREIPFDSGAVVSQNAPMYLAGVTYEILELMEGVPYHVRVKAENSDGVCTAGLSFVGQCGAYIHTTPSFGIPRHSPQAPLKLSATVVDNNRIDLTWEPASSTDRVTSYRVDAYTRSSAATATANFFGDSEIQMLSTGARAVTGGTFTVAFYSFTVQLPGTVSAYFDYYYFDTSADLTSYLEPGDKIQVLGYNYTVAGAKYNSPTRIYVVEPVKGPAAKTDVKAATIMTLPKSNPVPWNVDAIKLMHMLENTAGFGRVWVERTEVNTGYSWTITFTTNVGDQHSVLVNSLQLLGSDPIVDVSEIRKGVAPDNYRFVTVTDTSASFTMLSTGIPWYFRVLGVNSIGNGYLSESVSAVPADVPRALSRFEIDTIGGDSIKATFTEDAPSNGNDVTGYLLSLTSDDGVIDQIVVPVSHTVQKVLTSAHTLPFISGSTFSLALENYRGVYAKYGGKSVISVLTDVLHVDVLHNDTKITKSGNQNSDVLNDYVTPGEYIMVADQEFRVCLNQDKSFTDSFGAISADVIPICKVNDPWVAANVDTGFTLHSRLDLPLYRLDTSLGGCPAPLIGQQSITVYKGDATNVISASSIIANLSVGDYISLGHPIDGEVFRVLSTSSNMIYLGTIENPTLPASLSYVAVQHSTYEVQSITLSTIGNVPLNSTHLTSGFRLRFMGATTFVTQMGGYYGCLNANATAEEVQRELLLLYSINGVKVSRTNTSSSVTFSVTFTGSLVRGGVEQMVILDRGTNGCNAWKMAPPATSMEQFFEERESVMPVYKLQHTKPLAYDCEAQEMKDALESLSLVARVDVIRNVEYNGWSWTITFRGKEGWTSNEVPRLLMNDQNIAAIVNGKAVVYSIGEHVFHSLQMGMPYFATAAGVNAYGAGMMVASDPVSKQPANQVPGRPVNIRVYSGANSTVSIEWNKPWANGGLEITGYVIQWDNSSKFNSGHKSKPYRELVLPASTVSRRHDVQTVTVVSQVGYNPKGTFVLHFQGHHTSELDFNISALGMKAALEVLPVINTVTVSRVLFCSNEVGRNNCGAERGYVWMITFIDTVDYGNQFEVYNGDRTYESNTGHHLSVSGTYLLECVGNLCTKTGKTVAFVGTYPEVQTAHICVDDVSFSLLSTTVAINGAVISASQLQSAIETIPEVGKVTVVETGNTICRDFDITFNSFEGDVPLIAFSNSGTAVEKTKGTAAFVNGLGDYYVTLDDDFAFEIGSSVYMRVAAMNAIGASEFAGVPLFPIKLYEGAPQRPLSLRASVLSATSVNIQWDHPDYLEQLKVDYQLDIDTNAAFSSGCSPEPCQEAKHVIPLYSIVNIDQLSNMGESFSYVVDNLLPGQSYYIRARACTVVACSSWTYLGFPDAPTTVIPRAVPLEVSVGHVTLENSTTFAVDWSLPLLRAAGSVGASIQGFTVQIASPVDEVQAITFNDATGMFQDQIVLKFGSSRTRCFPMSISEQELDVLLEEMDEIDEVSVSLVSAAKFTRTFHIIFDGSYFVNGDVVMLEVDSLTSNCQHHATSLSESVNITEIMAGKSSYIPEIVEIASAPGSSNKISGMFDIRFGFKGAMSKVVSTVAGDAPITINNIVAGSKSISVSNTEHMLAAGAVVRVGDEEVRLLSVSSTMITVYPYITHPLTSVNIYISRTLLGCVMIATQSGSTISTQIDLRSEVMIGDALLIRRHASNDFQNVFVEEQAVTVATISANAITTSTPMDAISGSSVFDALLYKQDNRLMRYDSSATELTDVMTSLGSIGSVDVTRFGPTSSESYSWSVTFTSLPGTSNYCGISPTCLTVHSSLPSALVVGSCDSAYAVLDGTWLSDEWVNGRRAYFKVNGPYELRFTGSSWDFVHTSDGSVKLAAAAASTAIFPTSLGGSCSAVSSTSGTLSSPDVVVGSVVQVGVEPSFDNLVAVRSIMNTVEEIQSITITTSTGLLFGGYNLDFNESGVELFVRHDESALDMEYKLESLSTVGDVSVARSVLQNSDGSLGGYKWLITFLSARGDLPMMTYSLSPSVYVGLAGALEGGAFTISIEEVRKGVSFPEVAYFDNMKTGNQYSVSMQAKNSLGEGSPTKLHQVTGAGMIPMSFNLLSRPSAANIVSGEARSTSQIEYFIKEPLDIGGDPVQKYLIEYTTANAFTAPSDLVFRLYREGGGFASSHGYWRIEFMNTESALLPINATAE